MAALVGVGDGGVENEHAAFFGAAPRDPTKAAGGQARANEEVYFVLLKREELILK